MSENTVQNTQNASLSVNAEVPSDHENGRALRFWQALDGQF